MSNNRVILKRSSVVGKAPEPESLDYGEVALNYADGRLYYKDSTNAVKYFTIPTEATESVNSVIDRKFYIVQQDGDTNFVVEYQPGFLQVVVNGVELAPTDFTATNGGYVVIPGLLAGDEVSLLGFKYFLARIATKYDRRKHVAADAQEFFDVNYQVSIGDGKSYVQVFYNGILLKEDEYVATSGNNIQLIDPATADDVVECIGYKDFSILDLGATGDGIEYDPETGEITLVSSSNNDPDTLVYRDSFGNFAANNIVAEDLIVNNGTITVPGSSTPLSITVDSNTLEFDGTALSLPNGLKISDQASGLPGNFGFIGDETTDVLYLRAYNNVNIEFLDGVSAEPTGYSFGTSGITFPDGTSISGTGIPGSTSALALGNNGFTIDFGSTGNNWALFSSVNMIQMRPDESFSILLSSGTVSGGEGDLYAFNNDGLHFPDETVQVTAFAASGVTAGEYGSASDVPVITVNEYGQVTSATTVSVAGVSDFYFDSNTHTYTIDTADGGSYSASGDLVAFTTDDLTEGSNLYYTTARANDDFDTRLATKTTDDLTEGSNLYYTDARARASISVTDSGGDGSLSYDSGTGVITYTGPSAAEVRAHFSGGTGVTITDGVVAIGQPVATTDDVTFNQVEVDNIQFDLLSTTAVGEGQLAWNADDSTLNLGLSGGSTLQVGQEHMVYARNESGTTITNGTVVRVTGASGDKVTVSRADASSEGTSASSIGVATQNINNNSSGYITLSGLVRDLNTSSYTEGVSLWLGTNGQFTTTKPTAPNHLVHVGWVTRVHATEGMIWVHVLNGWEMNELHDVYYTTPNNGDVLKWNSTNSRWETYAGTTDNITEGSTNLYYTTARANSDFDTRLATKSTTDVAEGTNLYYTDARVQTKLGSVSGHIIPDTNITYDLGSATNRFRDLYLSGNSISLGDITLTDDNGTFLVTDANSDPVTISLDSNDTDDLAEGSTNLYYTNTRARAAISVTDSGGDGSLSYDSATGVITYTGPSATEVRAHLSAGTGVTYSSGQFSIGQDVSTTSNVTFGDINASGSVVIDGDLTINGTTTTISATNLAIEDNMVYLNDGSTNTNPDLGWAGNYNDGTYAHAGVFRDASDGVFKFYDGYTPEPGTAIDTTHASFTLADVQAGSFIGPLSGNATTASTWETARTNTVTLTGDVTGSGDASVDGSGNWTVSVATTVAANSVALGTDTTGNYVAGVTAGSGIAVSGTAGEGWSPTIGLGTSGVTAGSYGSSTSIPVLTVDAYGRITAASTTAITVGDATLTISSGSGLTGSGTFTANATSNNTITLSHADTSSQAPVDNSGGTVIQDLSVDEFGHVTGIGSVDLSTQFLGINAKSADSNLLDGLDSTQFLRSDANDTTTGKLTVQQLVVSTNNLETATDIELGGRAIIKTSGNELHFSQADSTTGGFYWSTGGTGSGGSGSTATKMALTYDGKLGIGTSSPGAALEVARGTAPFAGIFGAPGGGGKVILFKDNDSTPTKYNYLIGSQYNIDNGFEITRSTTIGGTTFSTPSISILSSGNVGIGTTSVTYRLDVAGTGYASSDFRAPIFYDSDNTNYYLDPASSGTSLRIAGGIDTRILNDTADTTTLTFGINNGSSSNDSNYIGTGIVFAPLYGGYTKRSAGIMQIGEGNYFKSGLAFYTNGTSDATTDWSERLRIDMDGNVLVNQQTVTYTSMDNTPLVGSITSNKFHVNGSIQLLNSDDAIVFGSGTSSFMKDEEIGFGWGGGWYMTDTTYLRVRNNKVLFNGGQIRSDSDMRAPIFYDQNNTSYYTDPASTSVLNNLTVNGTFSASGVVRYFEQTTAPAGANNGDEWYDTSDGILYKKTTGVWVQQQPSSGFAIFDVNGARVN